MFWYIYMKTGANPDWGHVYRIIVLTNFRHGLIFVTFSDTQKVPKFIPHMRMQCHMKLYCTGQNDEIKSRRKLKILEKSGNV